MPGKRVQFDDKTWEAVTAVAQTTNRNFQERTPSGVNSTLSSRPLSFHAKLSIQSRSLPVTQWRAPGRKRS